MYDQNLKTRMATMSPQQLQQFAMLHKDDPFVVSMALSVSNDRKAAQRQQAMQAMGQKQPTVVDQDIAAIAPPAVPPQAMQAAPQAQAGLPQLPAQNIATMADGGIAGYAEGGGTDDRESYRAYAMKKAEQLGLDPKFVDGIFKTESEYNPKAKSKTGPQGIGQLTSYIAKKFGITPQDRHDPYKNMDASMGFMEYLNKKYKGDKAKMAVAYNQGEGVLDEHLKQNGGKLVPENLHQNVKTANKNEPANYLKKMTDAGALAPMQTAETGTREAPRTPEMLARQKAAIARRELLASLPIGEARAGNEKPATKAGEFFPSSMLNPDIGKNLPKTKEGKAAPVMDEAVYDPMTGALISGGVPSKVGPQTKSPVAAQAAGLADIVPKALYGLGTTAAENVLALPFGKEVPTEKRRATAQQIMSPFYKYGTVGGITGLATDPAYATDPASQLLNVVQNNLEKSDEAIAAMTGAKPDNVRLARENIMAALPMAGKVKPVETGMPKLPGKGKPNVAADAAAAEAAAQAARAAEAEAKIAPLRLEKPTNETPGVIRGTAEGELTPPTGEAAAARARGLAALAEDTNAANLARKSATAAEETANLARSAEAENAAGTKFGERASNAGKAAAAISSAGVGLEEPTDLYTGVGTPPTGKPHLAFSEEPGYDFTKPVTPEKTTETTTPSAPSAPEKKTGLGALSDEDWMMLGLNMLQAPAGQSGNALSQLAQNIGRSGLATLGAKKEREKTEFDKLQKQALTDYYAGMTKHLGQEPEQIRVMRALQKEPALFDVYQDMQTGKQVSAYSRAYETELKNPLTGDMFKQQYPTLQSYLMANGVGVGGATLSPQGQSALNKYLPR